VIFELGLAIGSGAYVYTLRSKHLKRPKKVFSDLNGILEYRFHYRHGSLIWNTDLEKNLTNKIKLIAKREQTICINTNASH